MLDPPSASKRQAFLAFAGLVVGVLLIVVIFAQKKDHWRGGRYAPRLILRAPINWDPLNYAYRVRIRVGKDEDVRAVLDTGSPDMNLPQTLPCAGCAPTSIPDHTIYYGDGSSDRLTFVAAPVVIGSYAGDVVVGGSPKATSIIKKSDRLPIMGLAPLAAPYGYRSPTGSSIIGQLGVGVVRLDVRRDAGELTLWGGKAAPNPKLLPDRPRTFLAGSLVPASTLWAWQIDKAADFYVAKVSSPDLPELRMVMFDTGSTYSHLPGIAATSSTVAIAFGGGAIDIDVSQVRPLSPKLFPGMGNRIGVLGIGAMRGFVVTLNYAGSAFSFAR